MNRKFIAIAAAAVLCSSSLMIPAYAAELTEKNGKIYCVQEDGSYAVGWQKIEGKNYYFNENGEAVTKNSLIGKIRCDFGSDGVFKGKYTGWTTAGEKKFYYVDGIKRTGWYYYKDNWYYFNGSNGAMVTGTAEIDGITQVFSSDGIWQGKNEVDVARIYFNIGKKLSDEDYGGAYLDNNVIVIRSINDEKVSKAADSLKKYYPQIVVKSCRFSLKELESVREHLEDNMNKYDISAVGTYLMGNCVGITTEKINPELQEYIDSLDDESIVEISIGKITIVADVSGL